MGSRSPPCRAPCSLLAAAGSAACPLSRSPLRSVAWAVAQRSVEADPANMIAGFFMCGNHDDDVRSAHRAFLRRYGLDPATAPPLMRLDLDSAEPFELDWGAY